MSDLQARNAKSMMETLRRFQDKVNEIELTVRAQNGKIQTLTTEVVQLRQDLIIARTTNGNGPTG